MVGFLNMLNMKSTTCAREEGVDGGTDVLQIEAARHHPLDSARTHKGWFSGTNGRITIVTGMCGKQSQRSCTMSAWCGALHEMLPIIIVISVEGLSGRFLQWDVSCEAKTVLLARSSLVKYFASPNCTKYSITKISNITHCAFGICSDTLAPMLTCGSWCPWICWPMVRYFFSSELWFAKIALCIYMALWRTWLCVSHSAWCHKIWLDMLIFMFCCVL